MLTADLVRATRRGGQLHVTPLSGKQRQRAEELAEVYLGPGVRFPPFDDPPRGHVIHITPERVTGVGPWSAS